MSLFEGSSKLEDIKHEISKPSRLKLGVAKHEPLSRGCIPKGAWNVKQSKTDKNKGKQAILFRLNKYIFFFKIKNQKNSSSFFSFLWLGCGGVVSWWCCVTNTNRQTLRLLDQLGMSTCWCVKVSICQSAELCNVEWRRVECCKEVASVGQSE